MLQEARDFRKSPCSDTTLLLDALTSEVQLKLQKTAMAAVFTPDGKRLLLAGGGFRLRAALDLRESAICSPTAFPRGVADALTGEEIADIPFPLNSRSAKDGSWATISSDGERIGVFFPGGEPWWVKASRPR